MLKFLPVFGFFILFYTACRPETYTQGKRLYDIFCSNCHMDNGKGLASLYPPLANSDYLKNNPEKIPCLIRYGQKGQIIVNGVEYEQEMAGIPDLNDVEINNIINYINHAWGNDYGEVNLPDTKKNLNNCRQKEF